MNGIKTLCFVKPVGHKWASLFRRCKVVICSPELKLAPSTDLARAYSARTTFSQILSLMLDAFIKLREMEL